MLSVFIVEDDFAQRMRIKTVVNDYIALKDCKMELALATGNPIVLLSYLKAHPPSNAFFILDVNLQHTMDGFALASEIRNHVPFAFIIFVTTHAELSYLTLRHRLEAMDYIIKDEDDVSTCVKECLAIAYERYRNATSAPEYIQISTVEGYQNIPVDEILFFETDQRSHRLVLHLKRSRLELRSSLSEVEALHAAFFRCHMAYVVNVKNIKSVNKAKRTIEMVTGKNALVSRRKFNALLEFMQTHTGHSAQE